jgi:hypothetical protein
MKYGFRFLHSVFQDFMMNDTYLFKMPANLRPEIQEIITHLQGTGTGLAKLRLLAELGLNATSPEEFFTGAKLSLPGGTWKKLEAFVQKKREEAEAQREAMAKQAEENEAKRKAATTTAKPVSEAPKTETEVTDVKTDEPAETAPTVAEESVKEPAKEPEAPKHGNNRGNRRN